jgi:hypothetical protein
VTFVIRPRAALVALVASLALAVHAAKADSLAEERGGCGGNPPENVIAATPASYTSELGMLGPGDLLQLAAGTYTQGLPLQGLHGEPGRCIVIEGPASGPTARFTARDCCNTASLGDTRYLVLRNLEIDGENAGASVDGVKLESSASTTCDDPDDPNAATHHITLENLYIHDHDFIQDTVCISTKAPTWNWVVRNNVLERCGTGMYFGNSNGWDEFVHGLVEHNLVTDSTGYNAQIKHQECRNTDLGMPADGTTIVRYNVFEKEDATPSDSDPRPNLLVGHWPLSGTGADDDYLIYGNFFYENGTEVEALFQAEGNVILYDNLFVNRSGGPAVGIQQHNDVPKRIRVFQNTILSSGSGISISNAHPDFEQRVTGNAVFAASPLSGGIQVDNVVDTVANAGAYVTRPVGVPTGDGTGLDLHPLDNGSLDGAVDPTGITGWLDADRDFNAKARTVARRGAYGTAGVNPGWLVELTRRPLFDLFADGFESGDTNGWSGTVP